MWRIQLLLVFVPKVMSVTTVEVNLLISDTVNSFSGIIEYSLKKKRKKRGFEIVDLRFEIEDS